MPDLTVGTQVAGCRIGAVAGRGGMGVVYRATQLALERTVALKVIAPELARDLAFRARFQRESLIAASIEHPNAIPVYEAGELDEMLYLVMRWVEGTDLRELLRNEGPLAPPRAATLLLPIAAALHAAHRRGLVHRDIKPANVLVARDEDGAEHPYLTDFGIARRVDATMAGEVTLTQTGMMIGTVDFMAPELVRGERGDVRSDVYSFGCMLFEALAGRVPYPRDYEVAKLQAHVQDPPPSLADARPGLSPALDEVVRRAMAKRPEDRYQTAADLSRALAAAVAAPSTVLSPTMPGAAPTVPAVPPGPAESQEVTGPTDPLGRDEPTGPTAVEPPPTPPAPPPPAPPSRRRRTAPLFAGLGALALVGIVLALVLTAGGDGGDGGSNGDGGSSGGGGSSSPRLVPASASAFSISAPEGWGRTDVALTKSIERTEWTSDTDAGVSVLVDALPGSATPTEQRARNTRANTSQRSGYEELAFKATTLAGNDAWEWRYTLPGRGEVVDWFLNQCGDGFAVQGKAPSSRFDALEPTFRQVAESLRSNSC
jgi:serine/threonine protein kinase